MKWWSDWWEIILAVSLTVVLCILMGIKLYSDSAIPKLTVEECINNTLKLQSSSEVKLYYKIHTECQRPEVYLGVLIKLRGVK